MNCRTALVQLCRTNLPDKEALDPSDWECIYLGILLHTFWDWRSIWFLGWSTDPLMGSKGFFCPDMDSVTVNMDPKFYRWLVMVNERFWNNNYPLTWYDGGIVRLDGGVQLATGSQYELPHGPVTVIQDQPSGQGGFASFSFGMHLFRHSALQALGLM